MLSFLCIETNGGLNPLFHQSSDAPVQAKNATSTGGGSKFKCGVIRH